MKKKFIFYGLLVLVLLLAVYFLTVFQKRSAADKFLNVPAYSDESSKPAAEQKSYSSEGVSYDFFGPVKDKGEDWVLLEDKTPRAPAGSPAGRPLEPVKMKINQVSKIVRGGLLIDWREVAVGDFALVKTNQLDGEIMVLEFLLLPK